MDTKKAFAKSLKELRLMRGLTQEDFSEVSGRTYISMIERGLRCPTLEKIDEFACVLGVHPLALLCLTYLHAEGHQNLDRLFGRIRADLEH
jgi:transcriptional regulator with XRE-family HTH domain